MRFKENRPIFFNSRAAIAGAIIGLLLVFLRLEEEYWFSSGFFSYRKYYSFRRCFDLNAKVSKIAL